MPLVATSTRPDPHASAGAPSAWVRRFLPLIPKGGEVLDLACGRGRHAFLLQAAGRRVLAADRDAAALSEVAAAGIATLEVDLEADDVERPFDAGRFAGIVVTNYLHRPLLPRIAAALADGGVLIYETFARGNEHFGKPSNPDFLLAPGELLAFAAGTGLHVAAYETGIVDAPRPAVVQRLCALRAPANAASALPPAAGSV
ncbi:MAG: class I SAM-dependent methyltransferase [Burkholderiaceae bacterium]